MADLRRMLGELKAENRKLSATSQYSGERVGGAADQARAAHRASDSRRNCGEPPHPRFDGAARRSARSARSRFVRNRSEEAA